MVDKSFDNNQQMELDGNAALEIAIEQAEKNDCHEENKTATSLAASFTPQKGQDQGEAQKQQAGNGDFIDRALTRRMENGMDQR